jgi:hypothetical protein
MKLVDGWKRIIGYLLLSVPGLADTPMLRAAIERVMANPNKEALVTLAIQLILFFGVLDGVKKKLTERVA